MQIGLISALEQRVADYWPEALCGRLCLHACLQAQKFQSNSLCLQHKIQTEVVNYLQYALIHSQEHSNSE